MDMDRKDGASSAIFGEFDELERLKELCRQQPAPPTLVLTLSTTTAQNPLVTYEILMTLRLYRHPADNLTIVIQGDPASNQALQKNACHLRRHGISVIFTDTFF